MNTDMPIIMYQTEDGQTKIDVCMTDETVWLSQAQMADLFQKNVSTISRHINNIFDEGELEQESNLRFLQIANSAKPVAFYDLDVIISVGYRVKSLAHNRYDSAIYKARLKKNGVKVLYAKESIPDGPEGIILESLLEGMAEYYSADLSQKVKRGRLENAYKGLSNGGTIPLGYKIVDKRYAIDEEKAPVVRYIFEQCSQGVSVKEICDTLNSQGLKTASKSTFGKSLTQILTNEKYMGDALLQKTYTVDCLTKKRVANDGTVPQYYVNNDHEAIIPRELFARVQEEIKRRVNIRQGMDGKRRVYSRPCRALSFAGIAAICTAELIGTITAKSKLCGGALQG